MNHAHIRAILEGVIPEVKEAIAAATKPLIERIQQLEARQPEKGEKGDPGRDGANGDPGQQGPQGIQGLAGERGAAGAAGPQGEAGKAGEPGPPGKDGAHGDRGLTGEKGDRGEPGSAGRDGRDASDLQVIAKMIDERMALSVAEFIASFKIVPSADFRTHTLSAGAGDARVELELATPVFIDCGVWKEGSSYRNGDGVTWGGSFWIAQRDTDRKPDTPESGWRLAVKRGRDGRDGKSGEKGDSGAKGERGERGLPGYGG